MSALPDIPHSLRSNSFEEYKKETNPAEMRCLITSLHSQRLTHRNRRNQRSRATWIKRDEAVFILSFIFLVITTTLKNSFQNCSQTDNSAF